MNGTQSRILLYIFVVYAGFDFETSEYPTCTCRQLTIQDERVHATYVCVQSGGFLATDCTHMGVFVVWLHGFVRRFTCRMKTR